jgi:hypothetical protein
MCDPKKTGPEKINKEDLKEYLSRREQFVKPIYQALGSAGTSIAAGIHKEHGQILRNISTAAFIEFAESGYFNKDELNLVMQGMNTIADFFKKASDVIDEENKIAQDAKDNEPEPENEAEKESALDG